MLGGLRPYIRNTMRCKATQCRRRITTLQGIKCMRSRSLPPTNPQAIRPPFITRPILNTSCTRRRTRLSTHTPRRPPTMPPQRRIMQRRRITKRKAERNPLRIPPDERAVVIEEFLADRAVLDAEICAVVQ